MEETHATKQFGFMYLLHLAYVHGDACPDWVVEVLEVGIPDKDIFFSSNVVDGQRFFIAYSTRAYVMQWQAMTHGSKKIFCVFLVEADASHADPRRNGYVKHIEVGSWARYPQKGCQCAELYNGLDPSFDDFPIDASTGTRRTWWG